MAKFIPLILDNNLVNLPLRNFYEMGIDTIAIDLANIIQRPGINYFQKQTIKQFLDWPGQIIGSPGSLSDYQPHKIIELNSQGLLLRSAIDANVTPLTINHLQEFQQLLTIDYSLTMNYPINNYKSINSRKNRENALKIELEWLKQQEANSANHYCIIQLALLINEGQIDQLFLDNLLAFDFSNYLLFGQQDEINLYAHLIFEKIPKAKLLGCYAYDQQSRYKQLIIDELDIIISAWPNDAAAEGILLTRDHHLQIAQTEYRLDDLPIDEQCECYTCQYFTRSYLHHLYKSNEMLGLCLNSIHNNFYYNQFLTKVG